MTVLITLTTAGADSGPFNLYSDLDGYTSAFDADVAKSALLAGYAATVPDGTNTIRVMSNNAICINFIDITVSPMAITCLQYSLTGGTAGTTFGYRDCATDTASEITVGTGDTQIICANDAYVVYVISGDGSASSESICSPS